MADYHVPQPAPNPNANPNADIVTDNLRFYLTYLIGEFPSNCLLQRCKVGLVLSIYMTGWGKQAISNIN